MKKPRMEDYGLTEELIKEYDRQKSRMRDLVEGYRTKKKINLLVLIAIACIIIVCIIVKKDDPSSWSAALFFIAFPALGVFLWILDAYEGSISDEKRKEIENQVVDKKLENAVQKYNDATWKYIFLPISSTLNEKSLVNVDLLNLAIFENDRPIRNFWIVFSNIYLKNAKDYPEITSYMRNSDEFEDYYNNLIERQKSHPPVLKSNLNIEGEVEFYYPCSDLFFELEGSKEGDIVETGIGVRYKIKKIINWDDLKEE